MRVKNQQVALLFSKNAAERVGGCGGVCWVRASLSTHHRLARQMSLILPHAPFSIIFLFCSWSKMSREEQEKPAEITTQIPSNQRYFPRRLGKNPEALMPQPLGSSIPPQA